MYIFEITAHLDEGEVKKGQVKIISNYLDEAVIKLRSYLAPLGTLDVELIAVEPS